MDKSTQSHINKSGIVENFSHNILDTNRTKLHHEADDLQVRRISLGIIGCLINLAGLSAMLLAKKIKTPLKIHLCSLVANDFICVFLVLLSSIPPPMLPDPGVACYVFRVGIASSLMVTYFITCAMCCHNYAAVFHALKFHVVSTSRNVMRTVISLWLLGWIIGVLSSGFKFDFQEGEECASLANMPRHSAAVLAVESFLCAVCVFILNVKVLKYIRRRLRIEPMRSRQVVAISANPGPAAVINSMVNNVPKAQGLQSIDAQQRQSGTCSTTTQADNMNRYKVSSTEIQGPLSIDRPVGQAESCLTTLQADSINRDRISFTDADVHTGRPTPEVLQISSVPPSTSGSLTPHEVRLRINNVTSSKIHINNQSDGSASDQVEVTRGRGTSHESAGESHVVPTVRNNAGPPVLKKISSALCIVTAWSCALHIPFIIYITWSIALQSERTQLTNKFVGLLGSTLTMINLMSKPFLYMWRLVNWQKAITKARRVCCH